MNQPTFEVKQFKHGLTERQGDWAVYIDANKYYDTSITNSKEHAKKEALKRSNDWYRKQWSLNY